MATLDQLLLAAGSGDQGQQEGMFMKGLFKSLIQGTRASNAIPGGGDPAGMGAPGLGSSDFAYHAALYPEFQSKANEASDTVLQLIDKIVKHLDTSSDGLGGLEDATDPTAFEALADLMEDLLDDVESHLKGDKAAGGSGTSEMAERIRTVAGAARQTASRYNSMMSQLLDIPKPQSAFMNEIDNRRETSFVPRPHGKPDFRAPLSGRDCPHPYEVEIRNFNYLSWQLQAPKEADVLAGKPKPLDESPPLVMVDTPDAVAKMVCSIREELDREVEKVIAIDLEAHSIRSFQGLVCLMQLSTREQDYLIDTLAVRKCMSLLADLLADHTVVKVFHGAESDIKWLQRDFSLYIVNLFDTFFAARRLAFPAASLAYLLERYCAVKADKTFQLADWRARPLSSEMIRYAREDTHYLLYIHDCLRQELGHQEGRLGLQAVLDSSREISLLRYHKEVFDPEGYLKLVVNAQQRGPGKNLGQTETLALKALYDWRDKFARDNDESTGYLCPERLMIRIATVMPRTFDSLQECGNPLPPLLTHNAEDILSVIAAAIPKTNLGLGSALAADQSMSAGLLPPSQPLSIPQKANLGQMRASASSFTSFANSHNGMGSSSSGQVLTGGRAGGGGGAGNRMMSSSPDQLSTSPVLPTDDLYRTAGWTTPLAPPRQGWAFDNAALPGAHPNIQGLAAVPSVGNEGLDTYRGLDHTLDLSEDPIDYDSDDEGRPPRIPGYIDPMAAARALLRKEQGLPPVEGGAVMDFEDSDGEGGGGKDDGGGEKEDEGDGDDADLDMPRSMADIYRISNRNRRRNKEKKKQMDVSGSGDGEGGIDDEASTESGQAPTTITAGSSSTVDSAAQPAPAADPEIDGYFLGCKRKKHDSDDTVKFMATIGWIPPSLAMSMPASSSSGMGGTQQGGAASSVTTAGGYPGGVGGPMGGGTPPLPSGAMYAQGGLSGGGGLDESQMMMLNPEANHWQGGGGRNAGNNDRQGGGGGGGYRKDMGGRLHKGFPGNQRGGGGLPPAGPSVNTIPYNAYVQAQLLGSQQGGRGGGGGGQQSSASPHRQHKAFVDYSNLPASVIQAMSMAYVNPSGVNGHDGGVAASARAVAAMGGQGGGGGGGKYNHPYMIAQGQQQGGQPNMMSMAAQQQMLAGQQGGGGHWHNQMADMGRGGGGGGLGGYGHPSGRR